MRSQIATWDSVSEKPQQEHDGLLRTAVDQPETVMTGERQ